MAIFSRITPGPVERFLEEGAGYKNDTTYNMAMRVLDEFKKDRSRGKWHEYLALPIHADSHIGCMHLQLAQDPVASMMGNSGGATISSVRLEFPHFTITEMHHRQERGKVERLLVLATAFHSPEAKRLSMKGKGVEAIMDMPKILCDLYEGTFVSEVRDHDVGDLFIFEPS